MYLPYTLVPLGLALCLARTWVSYVLEEAEALGGHLTESGLLGL